jgi:uncharacterized OB-fold protein
MSSNISKTPPVTHFHLATDRWSEPFWQATTSHRLLIQRCAACAKPRMPPTAFCAACQSSDTDWAEVSGKGKIYSFTIITLPPFPEAAEHLPYVPAIIELDEVPGVRLISAVVGAALEDVRIGAAVALEWQDLPDNLQDGSPWAVALPRFHLV